MSSEDKDSKFKHKIYENKILLYKHTHLTTPIEECAYQFRYRSHFKTGYVRLTTGTSNLALAKKIAIEHYEEGRSKALLGLTSDVITLDMLWDKFNTKLGRKTATKENWEKVWKRLQPWWKGKDLSVVAEDVVLDYCDYRDRSWKKTPYRNERGWAANTIMQELALLRFLFKKGMSHSMTVRLPDFPSMTKLERRNYQNIYFQEEKDYRVIWTREQQKLVSRWQGQFRNRWKTLIEWERDNLWLPDGTLLTTKRVEKPKHIPRMGSGGKRFAMIRHYMLLYIIKNTFIRPQEVKLVQFKDIETLDNGQFVLIKLDRMKAKTNKSRECVFMNGSSPLLVFSDWEYEWERHYGRQPTGEDYLFPKTTDASTPNMHLSDAWRNNIHWMDEEIGVKVSTAFDGDGMEKTVSMYSIRKMAITNALRDRHLTPAIICRAAGTSEAMLSRFYNVNLNREYRYLLTQRIRTLQKKQQQFYNPEGEKLDTDEAKVIRLKSWKRKSKQ